MNPWTAFGLLAVAGAAVAVWLWRGLAASDRSIEELSGHQAGCVCTACIVESLAVPRTAEEFEAACLLARQATS